MTDTLFARLLGTPSFRWRDQVAAPGSRKSIALLAYLVLQTEPVRRERLAELLWQSGKLGSVRQALYELRKLPGADHWLQDDANHVSVLASNDVWDFEAAVAASDVHGALELWGGSLLQGLEGSGSADFEEWLELERHRLAALHQEVVEERALELERAGEFGAALALVGDLIEGDALNESAYRTAMRLLYLDGRQAAALNMFERCRRVLHEEFGTDPLPVTRSLAEAISAGRPVPIDAAVHGLPDRLLRVLQVLAVGRGELTVDLLARVLERDAFDVAAALAELEQRRLLDAPLGVARRVLSDVAGATPASLTRYYHARVAEALEAEQGPPSRIARHWLDAHEPERATPFLLTAAQMSFEAGDLEAAELRAFRVLWASSDADVTLRALLLLEGLCGLRGNTELQEECLARAEGLAWERQREPELVQVGLRRAGQRLRQGAPEDAQRIAQDALATAMRLADERLICQARNSLGGALFHAGRLQEAYEAFEINTRSADATERYRALNNVGAIAGLRGDLSDSYARFEAALTEARRLHRKDDVIACLNNLAATAERLAAYDDAVKRLREARALSRHTGNRSYGGRLLANLAAIYAHQGSLGPAWNTAQEVRELADALADQRLGAHAQEVMSHVARICGRLELAKEHAQCSWQAYERAGDGRKTAQLAAQLAVLEVQQGDQEHAHASTAIEALQDAGHGVEASWLWIELALTCPDARSAKALAARATSDGATLHLAWLKEVALARAAWLDADAGACDRLLTVADRLAQRPLAEAPALLYLAAGCQEGEARAARLAHADALLEEQSAGLPAPLRQALLGSLTRWAPVV